MEIETKYSLVFIINHIKDNNIEIFFFLKIVFYIKK